MNPLTRFVQQSPVDAMLSSELEYIRQLGSHRALTLAASNLGAFEAILMIMLTQDEGLPVYETIGGVRSRFCSHSGLLKRLRILRMEGLIEERMGKKRSEVRLLASAQLREELLAALRSKHKSQTALAGTGPDLRTLIPQRGLSMDERES